MSEFEPESNSPDSRLLGAQPELDQSTTFRVWAPKAKSVDVELLDLDGTSEHLIATVAMTAADGIWSARIPDVVPGQLYRLSINGKPGRPDPRSRFQPLGVHGPSQVVDPLSFAWSDQAWRGVPKRDLVIYEMHIGSFTRQGTYRSALSRLDELVDLGITAIELLPLAQSPGRWNWGYDGVNYFAPRNTFGAPDELKQFVNECHTRSLAVINDVVYNHVGPEGNYLAEFGPYRSSKRGTPWGDAFNFDGRGRDQVRQFIIDNIAFWIEEYHFDGVRLDAVHYMFDESDYPILDEIRDQFRVLQSRLDRETYLIGESNIYDPQLVGDLTRDKLHHDALWSDCLMHSVYAVGDPQLRLTDRHYRPTDLAEALQHGYVFSTPDAIRVTPEIRHQNHPAGLEDRRYIASLITALQTHDSVGNHPHGKRLHQLTSVEFQKAAAPLILLYPSIPMLFMGEEDASESPFPFFADFEDPRLRDAVDRGRREEYPHHDWDDSPLPSDPRAFHSTSPSVGNDEVRAWYQACLRLRKTGCLAGWLAPERFTVDSDVDRHLYRLMFDHPEGQLTVAARLDGIDAQPVSLEPYPVQTLLLDSRNPTAMTHQELPGEIQSQQCLVWIS